MIAVGAHAYYALVLARDLEPNLALGYVEVKREWQLSAQDWSVLLEWRGEGPAPQPETSL